MSLVVASNEEKIVLYIDSKYRTSGTSENFSITLASSIPRITEVEVVDATIPYTFYSVSQYNNTVAWSANSTTYSATVAPGNYTITSFVDALTTAMNAVMSGFTITWSRTTYKLTFANATAFSLLASSTAARVIGVTSGDTASATSVTCPGVANVGGPQYILIKSTALTRPKITRPFLNTTQDNVLYKVDVAGQPGDFLVEKNLYTNMLKYGVRQTFKTLDFQLVDSDGNAVDLNGSDWSVTVNLVSS